MPGEEYSIALSGGYVGTMWLCWGGSERGFEREEVFGVEIVVGGV